MEEQTQRAYIVSCGGSLYEAPSFGEALLIVASKCRSEATIYRATRVLYLTGEEVNDLQRILSGSQAGIAAGNQQQAGAGARSREAKTKPEYAVVFDQMYKGFADILAREITSPSLEFHEILGRGISEPLKAGERIYRQPARDDYDILKLLETLANQYRGGVLFFTGDKKLANQARLVPGVHVEYMPPGEVAGKEMALKLMAQRIMNWMNRGTDSRQA
ncbi:hypothetical protein [Pyrodictium abyssi]|uniref:hypothetical protein n=1 Tax=Pyrodictium abyssi TaxID=54256 RepID=UPI0030C68736